MILAALLAISIVPQSEVITEAVDLIEVNNFFDGQGRKVYTQIVFFDFDEVAGRHQVVDWRLMRPGLRPVRSGGIYVVRWNDTQTADVRRCVYAASFRETWTQRDIEVDEREKLPKEKRRGLAKPVREPVIQAGERSILR